MDVAVGVGVAVGASLVVGVGLGLAPPTPPPLLRAVAVGLGIGALVGAVVGGEPITKVAASVDVGVAGGGCSVAETGEL